ncbi:sialic acid-binding Ig-like lectin 12 [Sarcophilus harrisii]|uniref:sialic acid-binding Ig-like lectin 12 n=1 Tax=Sarcophilus harrisii TaxID=9305 RepID=UPI0013020885|nr:sialic acid-binding Ig-like lectin 12 [Sarcophilus harrisii]
MQMPAAVTVQEGLCITILCTFHHPPTSSSAAHGYWFKEGSNTDVAQPVATNDPMREVQEAFRGRFHLVGDPLKNNCTLRITDARKEDSGKYFFRIQRGEQKFNYINYHLDLKVTDLTEKPVIYSPGAPEEGHSPSSHFSHFWASVLKLQDHGSNLTCGMTFPGAGGRALTERTIQLNVTSKTKPDPLTVYIGAFFAFKIMVFLTLCLILTCVKFLRKKEAGREPRGPGQEGGDFQ